MKYLFILTLLLPISLFSQSAKTNYPSKSNPIANPKEIGKESPKEIPVPKNVYSAENYTDIEKKIQNWTLEEIESYAVANNPLYLAEKQNIGMARGDL
ncbi:MAG TPA: hypothetical protein PLG41_22465, partial [Leptospiraceae bacterium]|nr:hypothetical protein [Leptospiraceae bacterium]